MNDALAIRASRRVSLMGDSSMNLMNTPVDTLSILVATEGRLAES
jgi:hypothetical protein